MPKLPRPTTTDERVQGKLYKIFDKEKFRLVVLISVFVRTFYLFVRTPLHFFSHNTHKYAAKGVNFLKMVESLWVFLGQFWHM